MLSLEGNPKSRNPESGIRKPESGIRKPESGIRKPELRMMTEKFTLAMFNKQIKGKMSFSLQLQPQTVTVKNMTRFQQQPYAS